MPKFARVVNGIAVDISSDPKNDFHPDLAVEFIKVPDQVQRGWSMTGGKWGPPAEPEPYDIGENEPVPETPATPKQ